LNLGLIEGNKIYCNNKKGLIIFSKELY